MKIVRLSDRFDDAGNRTHRMCPFCFAMIPVDELYVDEDGQKWDSCGKDETECRF